MEFVRFSMYMFMQNIIKLSAAVYELSCTQAFFALSRNGKESENPLLRPWLLIYDLEILWLSCGCQDTFFCKISSSWVQRFMSYRANREKQTPTKTIQTVATAWTVINVHSRLTCASLRGHRTVAKGRIGVYEMWNRWSWRQPRTRGCGGDLFRQTVPHSSSLHAQTYLFY